MSVGFWKSHNIGSKIGSPLAAESHAAKHCALDLKWHRSLVESLFYADFDVTASTRT